MASLLLRPVVRSEVKRVRNIAFEGIKDCLDTVLVATSRGVEEIEIPALHRTNYWAILRYMYLNHSRPVYFEEFAKGVGEIMEEAASSKWSRFKAKDTVTTVIDGPTGAPVLVEQKAKDWQSRLITNGRNLCRVGKGNAYGKRLLSRGHVLRYETDAVGRGYFTLFLELTCDNTSPRRRGRKSKQKGLVLCGN